LHDEIRGIFGNLQIIVWDMNIIRFLKRIPRRLILRRLRSIGYSSYSAPILLDRWYQDIFSNKKTTLSQKLWAQKRGFLSDKINYFGLTNNNYKDYLSEFDYFWLHPINGAYSHWIDDKLTTKYILQPFSEYLPEYYYHFYNGEILRLADCPYGYQQTIRGVMDLLKEKHHLAAKFNSGNKGDGFNKLTFDDPGYYINNILSTGDEMDEFIGFLLENQKDEYLITEYVQAHRDFERIFNEIPSTVRIMVIREKNQSPRILFANIFFAEKKTGIVNNSGLGGVLCLVDIDSGLYSDGKTYMDGKYIDCKYHPDTNVLLEGVLPNWPLICGKIQEICKYIPQLRLMGFDIIITNDGFKILEINSHPGLSYMQSYFPVFKTENAREFFTWRLKEKQ
jgi:hypothetical protein